MSDSVPVICEMLWPWPLMFWSQNCVDYFSHFVGNILMFLWSSILELKVQCLDVMQCVLLPSVGNFTYCMLQCCAVFVCRSFWPRGWHRDSRHDWSSRDSSYSYQEHETCARCWPWTGTQYDDCTLPWKTFRQFASIDGSHFALFLNYLHTKKKLLILIKAQTFWEPLRQDVYYVEAWSLN